jgi:hypothetical protein
MMMLAIQPINPPTTSHMMRFIRYLRCFQQLTRPIASLGDQPNADPGIATLGDLHAPALSPRDALSQADSSMPVPGPENGRSH